MLFYEEDDYLRALAKFNYLEKKVWLLQFFELYKSTLNWPPGLPPINRCNLVEGMLRTKFNSFYREKLNEFEYELDYELQTLEIL